MRHTKQDINTIYNFYQPIMGYGFTKELIESYSEEVVADMVNRIKKQEATDELSPA